MLWFQPDDRMHIKNPVTTHSLSIWDRFKNTHKLQSPHNPLLSFLRNPAFYPAWESPAAFNAWSKANLLRLHQLSSYDRLLTFPTLCETFGLPRSELCRYLQIKNFYTPHLKMGSMLNQLTQFEHICKSDPHIRGLISTLYQHLTNNSNKSLPAYTTKWAQDLGCTFETADWSAIWLATKLSSINCSKKKQISRS